VFFIMVQRYVRRPRVLGRFLCHNAAAVVILLQKDAVWTTEQQAQPTPLGNPSGEEVEAIELVLDDLAGRD
jgi:hypothetical protein